MKVICCQIYFPSGTYVHASLEDYTGVQTINVHVYPSKFDHDQSGGLCGTLNGDTADDFMDRDGNLLSGEKEFNEYWRYNLKLLFIYKSE